MEKVLLLCLQLGCPIEFSTARYQLIQELRKQNYEIYVFYPGTIVNKEIRGQIQYLTNTLNLSKKDIRKKIMDIAPRHVIAFTYEDAVMLYNLPVVLKKTSFIYFNLEIYTPYMERYIQPKGFLFHTRCRASYIINKVKEVIYAKQCKLFVIQDALRKRVAAKFYLSHSNTLLIPNSYIYCDEEKWGTDRYGMIYSGGVNKNILQSLAENMDALPDLPITFSGVTDEWFRTQYKKICKKHPSIEVHEQKLSPEAFTEYLKQFAVGLIWYSPTRDENINNIGMSSGKFFKHLSLGQPVIVPECPGLSRLVEKFNLGIVIRDTSELKEAYEKIMDHYSYYQKNIKYVYKNKFDYAKVIRPFLSCLKEI